MSFFSPEVAPTKPTYIICVVSYISEEQNALAESTEREPTSAAVPESESAESLAASAAASEELADLAAVDGDDITLARALIAGHRSAATAAWQRFRPSVQMTLKRLLGPGEDIADLTQDVFARFFGKIHELRNLEAVKPFLIGIAFRRAREEIRRRHVRRSLRPMIENHFRESGIAWDPERRQTATRLVELLHNMGRDGMIYTLRVVEGRELAEVASKMNLSISTVRRRLNRVVKRIERVSGQEPAANWNDTPLALAG